MVEKRVLPEARPPSPAAPEGSIFPSTFLSLMIGFLIGRTVTVVLSVGRSRWIDVRIHIPAHPYTPTLAPASSTNPSAAMTASDGWASLPSACRLMSCRGRNRSYIRDRNFGTHTHSLRLSNSPQMNLSLPLSRSGFIPPTAGCSGCQAYESRQPDGSLAPNLHHRPDQSESVDRTRS